MSVYSDTPPMTNVLWVGNTESKSRAEPKLLRKNGGVAVVFPPRLRASHSAPVRRRHCGAESYVQVQILVATDDYVCPFLEGPKLGWDALPSVSSHDNHVRFPLRSGTCHFCEICHLLGQSPRKLTALSNPIGRSCSNDEGQSRHGKNSKNC